MYDESDFETRRVPEALLLDTCTVQALREAMAFFDDNGDWQCDAEETIFDYYGSRYGQELIALGNAVQLLHYNGAPWVVSQTSLLEFERARPDLAHGLVNWWLEWADYMDASADSYPELDLDRLFAESPDVHPDQMQLPLETAVVSPIEQPSFAPLKDRGDCSLVREALRAGVPGILTLDLRSFWKHRRALAALGVAIWRPRDYWQAIAPSYLLEA